jgi:predicted ribosomally synthesized peptide with nif11-like leader
MNRTEIERLVLDYADDPALRAQIDGAGDIAQRTAAARAAGYQVSASEIQSRLPGRAEAPAELTGRQLDAVAGGGSRTKQP